MQPQEENTFTQVPWFATTQTGSIDLYASAVSRYSSNLNHSNNSHSQTKTASKRNSLKKSDKVEKQNSKQSLESELSDKRRRSNPVNGSSASLSAWSKDEKLQEINSSRTSLKSRKNSFVASISNSKTSLRKLLTIKDTEQNTFIEPLDPIMSYSSQIEPSTNMRRPGLDANRYATKKTIAQGMLDVALLTANASQLKYVLQLGDSHPFYELMISLIVISIILQAFQGAFLLLVAINSINTEDQSRLQKVRILNYIAMSFSFGILVADTIKMVFVQDENYGLK